MNIQIQIQRKQLITILILDTGYANEMTEANEDSNSNSEEAVDTYPDPRNSNETTKGNGDSNSNLKKAVDTYPAPGMLMKRQQMKMMRAHYRTVWSPKCTSQG